jgi:hypothetical protein
LLPLVPVYASDRRRIWRETSAAGYRSKIFDLLLLLSPKVCNFVAARKSFAPPLLHGKPDSSFDFAFTATRRVEKAAPSIDEGKTIEKSDRIIQALGQAQL